MTRPCVLLPVVLAVLPSMLWAQSERARRDPQAALDRVVAGNNGRGGGVFQAVDTSGVLWEGVSGNLTRNGAPMQAGAVFEIASTSKTFTAALILLLAEEGLLDLDAPIGNVLPPSITSGLLVIQGHDYGPELTLRQLLSHTSGLPDYWYDPPFVFQGVNAFLLDYSLQPQHFWTPQEILSYVPGLTPIGLPGTVWHYADTNFVLAALIAEEVTGEPLEQAYRDRILQPLGLDDTYLTWHESAPAGLPLSYRYEGARSMTDKRQNSADWGGGGLGSSTRDLARFVRALADGSLFHDPASLAAMQDWVPTGENGIQYGLGLFQVDLGGGMGSIWGHDGYGNAWMYYWPKHDVTFTGTLNQTQNDWWPLVWGAAWVLDH